MQWILLAAYGLFKTWIYILLCPAQPGPVPGYTKCRAPGRATINLKNGHRAGQPKNVRAPGRAPSRFLVCLCGCATLRKVYWIHPEKSYRIWKIRKSWNFEISWNGPGISKPDAISVNCQQVQHNCRQHNVTKNGMTQIKEFRRIEIQRKSKKKNNTDTNHTTENRKITCKLKLKRDNTNNSKHWITEGKK